MPSRTTDMRRNVARQLIADGQTVVNAWLSSDSLYAAEVLGHCDFDTVTVDAQHGMLGRAQIAALLAAISSTPAMPMVRPPTHDPDFIGWCLDAGAYGLIVPAVDTPEIAATVARAAVYPPDGTRSFGPGRGLLYGGNDYASRVHEEITVWAMIESRQAVDSLDAILATPGLYGIYIGPNDLALDLGHRPGGRIGPHVADTIRDVHQRAQDFGIRTGIFCADGDEAAELAAVGFDLVTPGNDMSMLRSEAARRTGSVRQTTAAAPDAGGY